MFARAPLLLVLFCATPTFLCAQELTRLEQRAFSSADRIDLVDQRTSRWISAGIPLPSTIGDPIQLIPSQPNGAFGSPALSKPNSSTGRPPGCASFGPPPSLQSIMSQGSCERKPLSPGGKFVLAMKKTFYPLPLLWSAAGAGISQARNSDPGFGQGAKGYGRRLGDRIGTRGIKEITGTFLIASAFKMDPQYHPSTRRGFGYRLGNALAQVFVSRTDSGDRRFNFPSVLGAAIGVGVSNAWRVERDQKASDSAIRFGLSFAFEAASNFFTEFVLCRKHPRS